MYTVALRITSTSCKDLLEQCRDALQYKVHMNEVLDAMDKLLEQLNDYIQVNKPTEKVLTLEVEGYLASTIYCGLAIWEASINGVTTNHNIRFCSILEKWNKQFYNSCMKIIHKDSSITYNNISFDPRWNGLSMN